MIESNISNIDHFGANLAATEPIGEQARTKHSAQATVDPDQSSLVVEQVQDDCVTFKLSRFDDRVKLPFV
ncbi:MAG: hypothetical protein ACKOAH_25250, partial [Pirellula sp.]